MSMTYRWAIDRSSRRSRIDRHSAQQYPNLILAGIVGIIVRELGMGERARWGRKEHHAKGLGPSGVLIGLIAIAIAGGRRRIRELPIAQPDIVWAGQRDAIGVDVAVAEGV